MSLKCPCPDHFGTSPKMSRVNLSYVLYLFIKLVPCPCPNLPKNVSPDGHVPDVSWTCPQNVPVLTILGHLQIGRMQLSCGYASTSSTSSITPTSSNSSSSSTSYYITSHTVSMYYIVTSSCPWRKTYNQVTFDRLESWLSWGKMV